MDKLIKQSPVCGGDCLTFDISNDTLKRPNRQWSEYTTLAAKHSLVRRTSGTPSLFITPKNLKNTSRHEPDIYTSPIPNTPYTIKIIDGEK